MSNSTPIALDRLSAALAAQGVSMKRTGLLKVAAAAFGCRNVHELAAMDRDGGMTPPAPSFMGRTHVPHVGKMLFFQDPSGYVYAVEEKRYDEETGRAADWIVAPFGGLADVSVLRGAAPAGDAAASGKDRATVDAETPYLLTDSDCEHLHGREADRQALGRDLGTIANDFYPLSDDEAAYVDPDRVVATDRLHEARTGYSAMYRGAKHVAPTIEFAYDEDTGLTRDEALAEGTAYAAAIRPGVSVAGGVVHLDPDGANEYGEPAVLVRVLVPFDRVVAIGTPDAWRTLLAGLLDDPSAKPPTIRAEGREYAVQLEFIGEGEDGDYDPLDPGDRPLYRFDVQKRQGRGWEDVPDTSYCTQIEADVGPVRAEAAARHLLGQIETHGAGSLKRLCERLSWTTIQDVERPSDEAVAG
jgi:hypothetical protein